MSNKIRVLNFLFGSMIGFIILMFGIWFTKLFLSISFKGLIVI